MKQRLIDVNEAKAQIIEDKIPENYLSIMRATGCGLQAETLNQACDRHIKMLDELQAVDAIPKEWIKKQLKKQEYRALLIDYIEWDSCLDWLLDKWEKENETNAER